MTGRLALLLILFVSADASAQLELELLWESPPDLKLTRLPTGLLQPPSLDANGDGVADLVLVSEDESGTLRSIEMSVLSADGSGTFEQFLREDDVLGAFGLGEGASFYGFASIAGDSRAIFTDGFESGDVVVFSIDVMAGNESLADWRFSDVSAEPARLITVFDVFDDGSDDLVLALAGNDNEWRVQIWGIKWTGPT